MEILGKTLVTRIQAYVNMFMQIFLFSFFGASRSQLTITKYRDNRSSLPKLQHLPNIFPTTDSQSPSKLGVDLK